MASREQDRSQRSGSGSRRTVGQRGSSQSSGHQPEQWRGHRARIVWLEQELEGLTTESDRHDAAESGVARERRSLTKCTGGGRAGAPRDALGQSFRVGNCDPPRSGRRGWRLAISSRRRPPQRSTDDLGWGRTCGRCWTWRPWWPHGGPWRFAPYYSRLCQAGKAKTLALTACMRKRLPSLNAMVKRRTP